jgi:hypothetical protein
MWKALNHIIGRITYTVVLSTIDEPQMPDDQMFETTLNVVNRYLPKTAAAWYRHYPECLSMVV